MASDKPALVLLHGLGSSSAGWQDVVPLVSEYHRVYAPTTLGHRGGPPVTQRPVTFDALVDWTECYLDERGLDRPHLAGHSLGGYVALKLARRGRAATVCALSPGGFWPTEENPIPEAMAGLRRNMAIGRVVRPVVPLLFRSAKLRQRAMRAASCRPDRVTRARAVEGFRDTVACTLVADLALSEGRIAPMDPMPCHIVLVWAEQDKVFPIDTFGEAARARLPKASFLVLPQVGHDAMLDNPGLVASTILAVTGVREPN
jgi:pimeloyl-ACP methyl ester carboxylesterase